MQVLRFAAAAAFLFAGAAQAATVPPGGAEPLTSQQVATLAVPFLPNQGQADARVAFYAPLSMGTVYVTRDGEIVYSLAAKNPAKDASHATAHPSAKQGWTLTERLVSTSALKPKAEGAGAVHVNYFIGRDPMRWQHNLAASDSVSLGQVWPGIEVSLSAHANDMETIYRLAAHADVKRIRLEVSGARALNIKDGQLVADTGLGAVAFVAPKAWQIIGTERRDVPVRYVLHHQGYGFQLGAHDSAAPVVIDPDFQATYLGGSNSGDSATVSSMAVDASGDVYVAGDTSSTDFPGTTGGAQASYPGKTLETSFVAKLNSGLTAVEQVSYLGGTNLSVEDEYALAMVIDSSGDVYVAGETSSADFPGTTGGAQPSLAGFENGYIAKLSSDLKTLEQATYIGGSKDDGVSRIALDAVGDVYVAGYARSSNFPGVGGGYQTILTGSAAAFVAKLNSGLTVLDQATYFGGSGAAYGDALVVDSSGDVYVGGTAAAGLPGTTGGAQLADAGASSGNSDGFIAKLSGDLTTLYQATYLGGSGSSYYGDDLYSIALDSSGNVYAAGRTFSTDFPATSGGAQPATAAPNGNFSNGFVAKLDADLTTIQQATYIGGTSTVSFDNAFGLALDSAGDVYVTGMTSASDFPGTVGSSISGGVANGGYVAKFNPALTTLDRATYVGGNESEAIGLSPTGDVYATGIAYSGDLLGTAGGAQSTFGAASRLAYVVRYPADLKALTSLKLEFLSDLTPGANGTLLSPGGSEEIDVTVVDQSTDTDATGIVYTVTLPPNLSFQSVMPEFGTCAAVGQVITCHATNLDLAPSFGFTNLIHVNALATGPATVAAEITHVDQGLDGDSVTSAQLDVVVGIVPVANAGNVTAVVGTTTTGQLSSTPGYVGQTLTYSIVSPSSHGNVLLTAATGQFTYTPSQAYVGADRFSFLVTDQYGLASSAATEQITVNDVAATAFGTHISTSADTQVAGQTSVYSPYAGQILSNAVVSQPAHGALALDPTTGHYTYTPNTGFAGSDSFAFRAIDQYSVPSNTATIGIVVNDSPPGATGGSISTTPETAVGGTLPATAAYAGQDLALFFVVSQPAHGQVSSDPSTNQFTYTPAAGYVGPDSFAYKVVDQYDLSSSIATETVTVGDIAPTAISGSVMTMLGVAVNGMLSANKAYTAQTPGFVLASNATHGKLSLTASTGQFTYQPAVGFIGTDSFTFQVTDAFGTSSGVATESITVNDIAPTAVSESIRLPRSRLYRGTLLATPAYPGQKLTYRVVSGVSHGTVTILDASHGQFSYQPASGYRGTDSFTFQATDPLGTPSNTATVSFTIP